MVLVLCFSLPRAEATVVFDDGLVHEIWGSIFEDIAVYSDLWGEPTTVNIGFFGYILGQVLLADHSQAYIYGGSIGNGYVSIKTHHTSRAYIAGGDLFGEIALYQTSTVTLYGSDFMIDGHSAYGTFTGIGAAQLTGRLALGRSFYAHLWVADGASLVLVDATTNRSCINNTGCFFYENCSKAIGDCDGVGTCQWRAGACPLIITPPVCGCDGITYEGECSASMYGINIGCEGNCDECRYYLGDFNCDGNIDLHDFSILASAWLSEPGDTEWNPVCDIDFYTDSFIDTLDLVILAENYLSTDHCTNF